MDKEKQQSQEEVKANQNQSKNPDSKEDDEEEEEEFNWEDIPKLRKDIVEELQRSENKDCEFNYSNPTQLQKHILSFILDESNNQTGYFIQAPGGSGKTLLFAIPAIQAINLNLENVVADKFEDITKKTKFDYMAYEPQVIIIANTVILVDQIYNILKNITPLNLRPKTETEYEKGKINIETLFEQKQLKTYGQVLICTIKLLRNLSGYPTKFKKLDNEQDEAEDSKDQQYKQKKQTMGNCHMIRFNKLKYLMIDEIDEYFRNNETDITEILKKVEKNLSKKKSSKTKGTSSENNEQETAVKIICTSATFSKQVKDTILKCFKEDRKFKSFQLNISLDQVQQYSWALKSGTVDIVKDFEAGFEVICQILNELFDKSVDQIQALIFVNKTETVKQLKEKFDSNKKLSFLRVTQLSSEFNAKSKNSLMKQFRQGKTNLMIATNIMARGIDIRKVCLVINFYPPREKNDKLDIITYKHRIGRTGRFNDKGVALTLYSGLTQEKQKDSELEEMLRQDLKLDTNQKLVNETHDVKLICTAVKDCYKFNTEQSQIRAGRILESETQKQG